MSYLDLGYDQFFENKINANLSTKEVSAIDSDAVLDTGYLTGNKIKDATITNAKISSLSADKITSGTISAVTNLGDETISLDGENKRIVISDLSNRRVLLGNFD